MFDPNKYRADFPILSRYVNDKPLIYLDNAATSQKPKQVIEALTEYYEQHNANVHRGVHTLGDESTKLFHSSRQKIAEFFGAKAEELVAVRNTTEAVNQVCYTWGESRISAGDVIVLTELEHHSNLVPWQLLAQRKGARLEFIPVDEQGRVQWQRWLEQSAVLLPKVKLLAFSHVSNTLGTVIPLQEMIAAFRAKIKNLTVFVDGAQAAPHLKINFDAWSADFYAVSAHKMLGPMGIGGLLVKKSVLETLQPFLVGGGMIDEVTLIKTTFAADLEERFTPGTPDVAGLAGWAAACRYLDAIGMEQLAEHDQSLVAYTLEQLQQLPQLKIIGPASPVSESSGLERVGSVAFLYAGVHAHDLGQVLDSEGIAVRSGHHCTMPLHEKYHWTASTRISFQLYNTRLEIDAAVAALHTVEKVFGV